MNNGKQWSLKLGIELLLKESLQVATLKHYKDLINVMLFFQLDQKLLFPALLGEEAKRQLEKLLAYENANQECQRATVPIRETGTIIDYLKACGNLESETEKMQMLAKTMAAAFQKGK